jgi:hypothetical protein
MAGFGASRAPLLDLLISAGLSVTPQGGDLYGDIASAKLQLLASPDPVLTSAFGLLGLKWSSPRAPYGPAATAAWLGAVLKAVGKKAGPLPMTWRAAYLRLSKKAEGFRIGFVCGADEIPELDGGELARGVPLLSFLAEAGFKIGFLVHSPSPAAREQAASGLKALPSAVKRAAGLDYFDSPDGLHGKLVRDRTMRLLYSDMPMDPRAGAAGKASFSTALFEPGFEGAVETLRRLLALCEWDFNEKYLRR